MNNYILSYSPFTSFPSEGQLLGLVRINRHVAQFYQPFFGTYLLKSGDSAYVLNESFKDVFENTPYMLTMITSNFASGSLPQEVWNWINFGTVPQPDVPPPPTATGLLGSAIARAVAPPPPPTPPPPKAPPWFPKS